MKFASEVSLQKLRKDAEDNFRNGFFCCEALMAAVRKDFDLDVPEEVIAMSSGMAVGVGRAGCLCGALNGGVLALGMIFGRTEPTGPKDAKVNKVLKFTNDLHDWFKKANKKNSTCCRVLTKEFDMGKGEHKEQCIYYTGLVAYKTGEIICKELGIKNTDEANGIKSLDEELNL